jgi:hypothetical protein
MSSTSRPSAPVSCRRSKHDEYELALVDANGEQHILEISAGTLELLIAAVTEVDNQQKLQEPHATKLPKDFSIGTGRFEALVLLQFENETPYAFDSDLAVSLGQALLAHASELAELQVRTVH